MAYSAACPSCGAQLSFRSSVSLIAVCEFCRSTLVRHDKNLEDIGKMADLLPDQSIVQIGTEGVYEGVHFAVIGRIQLNYEAGIWNEWHVLFDNMRSGWLSEAGGVSWMTFAKALPTPMALAQAQQITAGQSVELDGRYFSVSNVDNVRCIAGQGELPFKVGAGYEALSIDLRAADVVASLDCSHDPALFFVGKQVSLRDLKLSNTRSLAEQSTALPARSVKSFACPQCAAPLTIYSPKSLRIACGSCGTLVDAENPTQRLVDRIKQDSSFAPSIELGSTGELAGQQWTAIGYLVRQSNGLYSWEEYLLMNSLGEFAWLVTSSGHWSFGQALNGVPRSSILNKVWEGQTYEHFERFDASASYVLGEFYWRVTTKHTQRCDDYIAPPRMLSCERNNQEENWTLLEYIAPEVVAAAFKLTAPLDEPLGVGVIQPNPHMPVSGVVSRRYFYMALLALVIQLLLMVILPHGEIGEVPVTFQAGANEEKPIAHLHLDSAAKNVVVKGYADLNNSWAEYNFTLTDEKSGTEMGALKEVSYYSGMDGGESWSEGSRNFRSYIGDLPPGDYVVTVDAETDPARYVNANARIGIEYGALSWLNFFLVQMFLMLFPALSFYLKHNFEVERWADSDHPKVSEDDDE